MKQPQLQKLLALTLAFVSCLLCALPAMAVYELPITPSGEEESIYLVHQNSGEVLLDKDAATTRYIASTTKMMTALLLIESGYSMDTVITIPDRLTQEFIDIQLENGVDMNLKIGEQVTMESLFYGLLLRSANDAASVIADELGGGDIGNFVDQMNARAKELGCMNTTFSCPHGLYDHGNVSTAEDLALIAAACAKEPLYMKIAATLEYTIPANNMHSADRVVANTNMMIDPEGEYYRSYIKGMKTGYTTLAGRCFVTTAEQNGQSYLLVVLNATKDGIFADCAAVLDWAFANFSERPLLAQGEALGTLALEDCYEATELTVYAQESVVGFGHKEDAVRYEVDLPDSVNAPVAQGDVIGSVTVYLAEDAVETVQLVAKESFADKWSTDVANVKALLLPLVAVIAMLALVSRLSAAMTKTIQTTKATRKMMRSTARNGRARRK